jgi:hypothetical protein
MVGPALELIQRMLEQLLEGQRNHTRVLDEHTLRLGRIEREMASCRQDMANLHHDFAGQSVRIDTVGDRLSRIERRIGLIDAS